MGVRGPMDKKFMLSRHHDDEILIPTFHAICAYISVNPNLTHEVQMDTIRLLAGRILRLDRDAELLEVHVDRTKQFIISCEKSQKHYKLK
jgi:hypothetical protein